MSRLLVALADGQDELVRERLLPVMDVELFAAAPMAIDILGLSEQP
jgi:hypothetical protein